MKSIMNLTASITLALLLTQNCLADDETKPPGVGDKAINFDLPLVGEKDFLELKEAYRQGPVVVIVLRGYPGYQCSLCRQQVGSLLNRAKTLEKHVSKVILVYPGEKNQLERHAKQFLGARTVPKPLVLVRDDDMKMVTEWGLRWDAPRETAYPATFVIDKNGRVAWQKVSKSHAGRTTTEQILAAVRKL